MNTPAMTRATLSPLRPMAPHALETLRRMAATPHAQPHEFRTLTDSDWAQLLRRARADGAAEGSALLARLRAKVRDAEAAPTPHADFNSTLLHE